MKRMVKLTVKYFCLGLSIGCILFVFSCIIGIQTCGEDFAESLIRDFARQSLGYMITGIICAVAAIVYQFDKIPWGIRMLIHFAVGMGAFCAISLYLGWFSFQPDQVVNMVRNIGIFCGGFIVLWICFYLFYHYECMEARKINERLQELEPNGVKGEN